MITKLTNVKHEAYTPYLSKETLLFHYDKHHIGYEKKYNTLTQGTEFGDMQLEDSLGIISDQIRNGNKSNISIFNNGAQVWNHNFYWHSMDINMNIEDRFPNIPPQSRDELRENFISAGEKHFGSGWLWIVKTDRDQIDIMTTSNADSPLYYIDSSYSSMVYKAPIKVCRPILVCDLWEHAYYIDYRNDRRQYLENFFNFLAKCN